MVLKLRVTRDGERICFLNADAIYFKFQWTVENFGTNEKMDHKSIK